MTLREKQSLFVKCLAQLITYANAKGYELTLGEGYVSSKTGHMANSLHYSALAQDLNLFVNGAWMDKDCPEWHVLGRFWKSLAPEASWGGEFKSVDLNHFSIAHEGRM